MALSSGRSLWAPNLPASAPIAQEIEGRPYISLFICQIVPLRVRFEWKVARFPSPAFHPTQPVLFVIFVVCTPRSTFDEEVLPSPPMNRAYPSELIFTTSNPDSRLYMQNSPREYRDVINPETNCTSQSPKVNDFERRSVVPQEPSLGRCVKCALAFSTSFAGNI